MSVAHGAKPASRVPVEGALEDVSFRFGPIVLRHESADPKLRFGVRSATRPFVTTNAAARSVTARWRTGEIVPPRAEPIVRVTDVWAAWLTDGGGDLTLFYVGDMVPWLSVRLDGGFETAEIVQAPLPHLGGMAHPGDYPVSEYMASRLLARCGHAEVHASAVVMDGGAHVFVGHSGAGKSTISLLAEAAGAVVLSDDRAILSVRDGTIFAAGTPWCGTGGRGAAAEAPVIAVYLLRQSEANSTSPVPRRRAFRELLARQVIPRVHAEEITASAEVLAAVADRVPVLDLHFRPTGDVVDWLREPDREMDKGGSVLAPRAAR